MTHPEDIKHNFYEDLHIALASVPKTDRLYIISYLNSMIVSHNISWNGIIGSTA